MLSLRNLSTVSARPVRRTAVVVRGTPEDIAAGVVRVFTPNTTGNVPIPPTETGFTGDIKHHGESGSRRPFKDGWTANPKPLAKKVAADGKEEEEVAAEPKEGDANVVEFMNKAVESVVAHNFTGDASEPEHWKKGGDGGAGFSGDIHSRTRDGFHNTKK